MEPYTLTDQVERFNPRYTAFARARWDATCLAYKKQPKSAKEVAACGTSGYTVEDFALHAGAWAMAGQMRERTKTESVAEYVESAERGQTDRYDPTDRNTFTQRLKRATRLYGAFLVGITRVDPLWIYACDEQERPVEWPEDMHTAVVIAIAMDYDLIRTSPSVMSAAATGNGYSRMAFTAVCVARYLTELGWRALPSGNDTALSIPLAIDAGLGESGRNGLLITSAYGPRVRLCKVFTDAPLVPDQPISFGVKAFCEVCVKCAKMCPSRAISQGEMTHSGPTSSNNPGVLKWYINPDKCLAFWRVNGTSCANCIRSCPFNKPVGWIHTLARLFIRARSNLINRALVHIDDLCGYGFQEDAEEILRGKL